MQKPVPASYDRAIYYAEHALLFTAVDDTSRFGRYRWMPEAGEAYISTDDASKRSANFLREELKSRLQKVRSCSASSCNWLGRAIRKPRSPPCGRRTGPWSS